MVSSWAIVGLQGFRLAVTFGIPAHDQDARFCPYWAVRPGLLPGTEEDRRTAFRGTRGFPFVVRSVRGAVRCRHAGRMGMPSHRHSEARERFIMREGGAWVLPGGRSVAGAMQPEEARNL
jgi:hypothetical protein